MNDEDDSDNMWHTGLHARLDTSFPKKCTNCGRIFGTAEQYFTETIDISEQDRGLKSFVDDIYGFSKVFLRSAGNTAGHMWRFIRHTDDLFVGMYDPIGLPRQLSTLPI